MSTSARSLHRQLFVWLLMPQVVLWLAAALFTYKLAEHYANATIDASLSQTSRTLARQVKPLDNGLFIDFPRAAQDILEADPSDRVLYTVSMPPGQFILGNRNLPPLPRGAKPVYGEPFFYNGKLAANDAAAAPEAVASGAAASSEPQRLRVAALLLRYGTPDSPGQSMLVQVARSSTNREALARQILLDTVLPLSALMALMTMIVWAGVRTGLRPLAVLQSQVEGRAANDLTPIKITDAPPEVRSLALAMNSLLVEVNHNVVAQKRFISDAAHQLRTPLAGLKSQTELALLDAQDPALRARLQLVHSSATRSAHLVNQLLSLARAEPESASQQARSTLDLRQLARELTTEMVPRALAAGIDLGFEAAESCSRCPVRGFESLLREALFNLIDNAIRYAGRGASVTVRVELSDGQAIVEVEDNGPGLPESECEHVFERFVRATHDGTGCGLGLAIVREIVERHAGRVCLRPVQAQAPFGALVRVTLPAAVQG
ncbi:sensor histidine kinase [Paucibacter aquatile]|uniref:histidine kinase n=1 Tax=Kinneretia aquatilis TaxID=2070761 RepID=A0A2N8KT14_9BURK|nr:sensor histidine kinase [Paucibacter aquatile]PND36594.1 sensor histidine kinase [Paucibacter aquatile]WIV95810.1 sensor histidine kinase [Paucibacter aquatile]